MRCPYCAALGAAPLFRGVICLWSRCIWYDPKAWDKAVIDAWEYTVNGDPALLVEESLKALDGTR